MNSLHVLNTDTCRRVRDILAPETWPFTAMRLGVRVSETVCSELWNVRPWISASATRSLP